MALRNTRVEGHNKNAEYIKLLISEGEHQQLDFKFSINDSRKIARSLVAFANTNGGRLLVGVKDNGAIAGVRSEEEFYMVEAAANLYSKPSIDFVANEWIVDTKKILEIIIPKKNDDKLLYAVSELDNKNLVYIRQNDCNYQVNIVWLKAHNLRFSEKNINIQLKKDESKLLSFMKNAELYSFSRLRKLLSINKFKLENILAKFVAINILEIVFTQQGIKYKLVDNMQDFLYEN
ncbi:MAG: ATP-binding protein [Lentimicrobiaceae bacterium]|nr:ATP-binding protein [Lentimicrobiaceae bacterium]